MVERKIINKVAMYLRKSRGDIENALDKHRDTLSKFCIQNGWVYREYTEIGSGDSIFSRHVFQKLLDDVANKMYDAVVVMDIDRLGRGDMGEQDKIRKHFAKADTLVVTPQQIFDYNNAEEAINIDIRSFIARAEYTQIVKRLTQGKKTGSRFGMWTNGTPPYPYEYQRWKDKYKEKGLVVNDDKLKVYRFIIDSFIKEHKSPRQITFELNRNHILSPRGGIWHDEVLRRLLVDETHLGKIISNKTKGNGHKNKKPDASDVVYLPRSEWVIVENCHEPVLAQDEHDLIMLYMSRLQQKAKRKVYGKNSIIIKPLSGLVKCGKCGHVISIMIRKDKNKTMALEPCGYVNPIGEKCKNSGVSVHVISELVFEDVKKYKDIIKEQKDKYVIDNDKTNTDEQIETLTIQLKRLEKSLNKIQIAFEDDIYTPQEFKDLKSQKTKEINDIKVLLKGLEVEKNKKVKPTLNEKYITLENFFNNINNDSLTDKQKNDLYKSIISDIIYTRNGKNEDISIKVIYK